MAVSVLEDSGSSVAPTGMVAQFPTPSGDLVQFALDVTDVSDADLAAWFAERYSEVLSSELGAVSSRAVSAGVDVESLVDGFSPTAFLVKESVSVDSPADVQMVFKAPAVDFVQGAPVVSGGVLVQDPVEIADVLGEDFLVMSAGYAERIEQLVLSEKAAQAAAVTLEAPAETVESPATPKDVKRVKVAPVVGRTAHGKSASRAADLGQDLGRGRSIVD